MDNRLIARQRGWSLVVALGLVGLNLVAILWAILGETR
jgi:hypothetical protein